LLADAPGLFLEREGRFGRGGLRALAQCFLVGLPTRQIFISLIELVTAVHTFVPLTLVAHSAGVGRVIVDEILNEGALNVHILALGAIRVLRLVVVVLNFGGRLDGDTIW